MERIGGVYLRGIYIYVPVNDDLENLAQYYLYRIESGFCKVSILATTDLAMKYILWYAGIEYGSNDWKAISKRIREVRNDSMEALKKKLLDHNKVPEHRPPFKHQLQTMVWSFTNWRVMLSLDMGLGKSITSILKSEYLGLWPTLIVCPASVKHNWYKSMTEDWGFDPIDFSVLFPEKRKNIRGLRFNYLIINYESVGKYMKFFQSIGIKHIIADECHYIKNTKTTRYKALAKLIGPETHVTLLSGTPITNKADDAFAHMKTLGNKLGQNKNAFEARYLKKVGPEGIRKKVKNQNLDELRMLMANHFIRFTKEQCLDLPDKNYIQIRTDIGEFKEEYERILREVEQQENRDRFMIESNIHSLSRVMSMAKVGLVCEVARSIIESGEKVVIFGGYTDSLRMCQAEFKDESVYIDGSIDSSKRGPLIEKFWKDEDCKVFIGNMRAAGSGIELFNAVNVVFLNLPFIPSDFEQAVDRLHRIGQNRKVNIFIATVTGTIDERIYKLMSSKMKDIKMIMDGKSQGMDELDITEVLAEEFFNVQVK